MQDDLHDGEFGRSARSPGSAPAVRSPYMTSWTDLWQLRCEGMSSAWPVTTAQHWRDYFSGVVSETLDRVTGAPMRLDEYIELRRRRSGMYMFTALTERCAGFELPRSVLHATRVRCMREACAYNVSFTNDLYSIDVEEAQGRPEHNIVTVLSNENGYGSQKRPPAVPSSHGCGRSTAIPHPPLPLQESARRATGGVGVKLSPSEDGCTAGVHRSPPGGSGATMGGGWASKG